MDQERAWTPVSIFHLPSEILLLAHPITLTSSAGMLPAKPAPKVVSHRGAMAVDLRETFLQGAQDGGAAHISVQPQRFPGIIE